VTAVLGVGVETDRHANATCRDEQLVKAELPAGEMELVGQAVHDASAVCPVAVPYLPAQHRHGSVHGHQPLRLAVQHHSCTQLQGAVLVGSITFETITMVHRLL
jgi:hypothetical protein